MKVERQGDQLGASQRLAGDRADVAGLVQPDHECFEAQKEPRAFALAKFEPPLQLATRRGELGAKSQFHAYQLLDLDVTFEDGEKMRPSSALVSTLRPRERLALELRFGLGPDPGLTLRECGERLEVCAQRVRWIEAQALRTLRRRSLSTVLAR